MAHIYNPRTQLVKAGDSEVQGQPQVSESTASIEYIRSSQENKATTKEAIYYLHSITGDQILREGK